jgi:hypothetical protein
MDLCLQLIFNELEAPGHWQYRECVGFFFIDFLSHSDGTGVGPTAAGWTCVCNSLSMNLKPRALPIPAMSWLSIFSFFFFIFEPLD